jgi:flagellar biosynthesis protein FlhB
MSTQINPSSKLASMTSDAAASGKAAASESMAAAFALSAVVVIIFSTALAWIKDAYEPLNTFMASLTGHHWTTHGLVDVALFFLLGWLFLAGRTVQGITNSLIWAIIISVIVAGSGLAGWFLLI